MAQKFPAAEVVKEFIDRFPNDGARTIARRVMAQHPQLFKNLEGCRSCVRQQLGVSGSSNRKKNYGDGKRYRAPRQAGMTDVIPVPIDELSGWEPFVIKGAQRALVLNDIHIPFHDEEALEAALEFGLKQKPTLVILNGDIADCYTISRWQTDPRLRDFPSEVKDLKFFLAGLRKRFPKARIVYKLGNHEERYETIMLHKCPEFLGLDEFEFKSVFHLNDYKVEIVDQKRILQLGHLNLIHGHEYVFNISNPVNPARGLFNRGKSHAVCGHFHQTSEHSEKSLEQKVVSCWSVGALCNLHPAYRPLNNWNHGCLYVETEESGAFHVQNMRIIKGRVY